MVELAFPEKSARRLEKWLALKLVTGPVPEYHVGGCV
jgi:hypothetical protein